MHTYETFDFLSSKYCNFRLHDRNKRKYNDKCMLQKQNRIFIIILYLKIQNIGYVFMRCESRINEMQIEFI